MLKVSKKISYLLILFLIVAILVPGDLVNASTTTTYCPIEKTTGLVRNPGMGWVLYCDAFAQMTNSTYPDYDKGVFNPTLFWQTFDNCGATEKASIFYLRAPWSYFEPTEGQFAWDNNPSYQALIQGALDRGLKLAFRVYIDSKDSFQQATPQYVKNAGASGYTNTFWTPYANATVFLDKYTKFIAAFGEKYNDPSKVDFIDGMGIGWWGECHNIKYTILKPGNNINYVLDIITNAYKQAFTKVLLGGQQGGGATDYTEKAVTTNKYDILRRDSIGMPSYYTNTDRQYYTNMVVNYGIPLFAENGWNYFGHDFAGYMNATGNYFSNIRSMLVHCLDDAKASRANTFDLRVPEDAIEWMNNVDLVDDFVVNGGYRFVPVSLTYPNAITSNSYITVQNSWKNTAVGRLPNNRPQWNYKYKVAFALLNPTTGEPVSTKVTNIDPSDWLLGNNYSYDSKISFGNIPDGMYNLAYSIVDTSIGNVPAINLAINDAKTSTGWHIMGQTAVSGISSTSALATLEAYNLGRDYSAVQGQNQWYYMQWNGSTYSNLTWEANNNMWKGSYSYTLTDKRGSTPFIHPDTNDTVIAWKAPKAGTVKITGNVRKDNLGGGDGVNAKILHNSTQVWPASGWQNIAYNNSVGISHNEAATVAAGDMVYFVVNKNSSNSYDGSTWNPTVEYID